MSKILPHDETAERAIVGALLLAGTKALREVADLVQPADFYHPTLAELYRAALDLEAASVAVDQVTLAERLRATGKDHTLRAHGGEAFFGDLMASVVTVENVRYYARIVKWRAVRRRVTEAATEIAAKGMTSSLDDREFVADAEQRIFAVADARIGSNYTPAKQHLRTVVDALERRTERKGEITGIPSGIHRLDTLLSGFQSGDLVVIAARPSMGKTSLMMNAVEHAAIERRVPCLVFSLEMSADSLMERVVSSRARVDSARLRNGQLSQRDWITVTKESGSIAQAPMWIDDSSAMTLREIRAKAMRWRANRDEGGKLATEADPGAALVAVDYLQLIHGRPQGRDQNREREIAEVSRGLKGLAKDLRCPVLALSQLNRGLESRSDKRPTLADIRESGAIEQDADVIAFIYRDEVYNRESRDRGIAEIIVAKQRKGATATVRAAYRPEWTRFDNLAESREYDGTHWTDGDAA